MTRSTGIAVRVGALVVGAAAAGFLVTSLLGDRGLAQAGTWVVHLTTHLKTGGTVTGSGVVLTSSGEVVTSYQVVNGAVSIAAEVGDAGTRYFASTFALSPIDGVAILQLLDATGLPTATIGTSSTVAVGDHVTAIGNVPADSDGPADLQGAVVSLGQTVSASAPYSDNPQTLDGLIEFSTPLPAGGAGGPLIDTSGRLIGIDNTDSGHGQRAPGTGGVGYAIPIDSVMSIVRAVNTHTERPDIIEGNGSFLGIQVLDSEHPPGASVIAVGPGTPAAVGGIITGDVIVSVAGVAIDSVDQLREQLQRHHGGDRISVGWLDRAGRSHSATVQLAVATFT